MVIGQNGTSKSFTVLMIVIGAMIVGGIVALIVCRFLWGTGANKDRKSDDAVAIAMRDYGCDEVLAVSAVTPIGGSRYTYYVLGVKDDIEISVIVRRRRAETHMKRDGC